VRTTDEVLEANFACVKGAVGCDQVAKRETDLRSEGGKLRGLCPLPDHNGDSRSFYCYSSGQNGFWDSWYCHRCGRGGDVVDLWEAQEGPFGNAVWAMQALADAFGLKLWREEDFHTSVELARIRAERRAKRALEDAITAGYFQRWVMPEVNLIEDGAERKAFLDEALKTAGLAS
jgi:hypothetical protein